MKRVALIDGDVLVYKVAFSSEEVIDWGDGLITLHSHLEPAKNAIDSQIGTIMDKLKADSYIVALTCHETRNFRKNIYEQYKANRTEKRKPIAWKGLREHLLENHDAKVKPHLEADDVLGILATMKTNESRVIVSIDKDFKTIPGKFFRLNYGNASDYGTMIETTEAEADFNFMLQTLTGDTTDNYPGCPGLGEKRGTRLLKDSLKGPADYSDLIVMWGAVVKAFEAAGFGPEYALTQARCARILRASDYDFKSKQPILWSPPNV